MSFLIINLWLIFYSVNLRLYSLSCTWLRNPKTFQVWLSQISERLNEVSEKVQWYDIDMLPILKYLDIIDEVLVDFYETCDIHQWLRLQLLHISQFWKWKFFSWSMGLWRSIQRAIIHRLLVSLMLSLPLAWKSNRKSQILVWHTSLRNYSQ